MTYLNKESHLKVVQVESLYIWEGVLNFLLIVYGNPQKHLA